MQDADIPTFASPEVEALTETALRQAWDPALDLPWDTPVSADTLTGAATQSLLSRLPEYAAMAEGERQVLRTHECVYHLSNLLAGEHRAVQLTAQVITECPQEGLDWVYFGSTVLADERNHFLALRRYLRDKVGRAYAPHPALAAVMRALLAEGSYEIKLFVAQVALEWTATALLSSLLFKRPEPLLQEILRRVLADESRHLQFNRWAFGQLAEGRRAALAAAMEDLLFESIAAVTASFFAVPVWREFGLSQESCRRHTIDELAARGVLRFYAEVLPRQLARCRLGSERLVRRLDAELVPRVLRANQTFEPVFEEAAP